MDYVTLISIDQYTLIDLLGREISGPFNDTIDFSSVRSLYFIKEKKLLYDLLYKKKII